MGDEQYTLSESGRATALSFILDAIDDGADIFDRYSMMGWAHTRGIEVEDAKALDLDGNMVGILMAFVVSSFMDQGITSMEQLRESVL